ncbi:cytochrome P450 [Microbacterium invictum]|uniref:Cytochrome P450 n=1 Tax=Microbacterium invictum TaxID=515415 RepID=A0AA40SLD3_9MICO|nr:cytochrome P450 [Microbacterium invictum]MBB4138358.1 cytochrome P450 [Microbacterium invictum]
MSRNDVHSTIRERPNRVVLRRHADVVAAAHDPETFSAAVSQHLQIPNGLDGAPHAAARRFIDPFFTDHELDGYMPGFERIAEDLVASLASSDSFDAVADLGARFAVRAQSHWLGWTARLEDTLLEWVADNRAATRSGDKTRTTEVAARFDGIIRALLAERRAEPHDDLTTRLTVLTKSDGTLLTDPELVSILRNWTGGDLSSIALCAGVVVAGLMAAPQLAARVRAASDAEVDAIVDELLRRDDPFVSNRRRATRDTSVGGCPIAAGQVVVLDWREANTDPEVFGSEFDAAAHADDNLVYGTGPHVCPGRPLAARELRVLVRAVLAAGDLEPAGDPVREEPPVAGYRTVPVRIR